MILAALVVLAFASVAFVDWIYLRKRHGRAFGLELTVLIGVLVVAVRPDWLTEVAAFAGIGRGVDLLIYPALVWLFREAVLGRVRYYSHQAQITSLVRHLAKVDTKDSVRALGLLERQDDIPGKP